MFRFTDSKPDEMDFTKDASVLGIIAMHIVQLYMSDIRKRDKSRFSAGFRGACIIPVFRIGTVSQSFEPSTVLRAIFEKPDV